MMDDDKIAGILKESDGDGDDADDGLITDPFSDDEEEIPEDAISDMTQKHKKPTCEKQAAKPKNQSSTEESGGSQLSENASMDLINRKESDDTNGAERDEVHDDAASKTGNNDEADEMEGVNDENGDVERESEDEEGNGDENKGKGEDGEETVIDGFFKSTLTLLIVGSL